jgi:cell shape-determining protein MreD
VSDNGRISVLFGVNLLLFFAAGEINNLLSGWAIHLHLDALLVIFFGLFLKRISSLLCTALLGFLADALHPVPAGTYAAAYILLWLFFVWCQHRIRRQNRLHVRTVAAVGQFFLLSGLTLLTSWSLGLGSLSWQRIALEILLSCLVVFLCASFWCRFQKNLLYAMGWDLEAQMSPL